MKPNSIKKTVAIALVLIFTGFCVKAQNPTYNQLISILSSKLPNISASDKIIAFTTWSAANLQSRKVNQEFDKVGNNYQGAKLKNGKGMLVISCNTDDAASAVIIANRDGITYALKINKAEFDFLNTVPVNSNVAYDATGAKVGENLTEDDVFPAFNKLITR